MKLFQRENLLNISVNWKHTKQIYFINISAQTKVFEADFSLKVITNTLTWKIEIWHVKYVKNDRKYLCMKISCCKLP